MANARYGCQCGETVFDLSGRAAGSVLTCPFCQRQYTYVRDALIEPFDEEDASSEDRAFDHQPGLDLIEDPPPAAEEKAGGPERRRFSPAFVSGGPPPHDREARKSDALKRKLVRETVRMSPRDAAPVKRSALRALLPDANRPIPGGAAVMIVAIVLSVLLSLTALSVLLPSQPNGTRTAPWGVIPKEAFWPEIVALVLGHVVGFFCWSFYLYLRQKVTKKTN